MGVMKAVQGTKMMDVFNPEYQYIQCVYWVWAMAEPNVTIISASIPVLRGFMRSPRTRSGSKGQKAGTYLKTGDNSASRFYNRSVVTTTRPDPKDNDNASDSSILGGSSSDRVPRSDEGITWTHEVTVEYESQLPAHMKSPRTEAYEMGNMRPQ
ncbi:hypothetical protein ACHAPJ_002387 [Fusarium lateritium]